MLLPDRLLALPFELSADLQHILTGPWTATKRGSLTNAAVRLFAWPVFLSLELLQLSSRVVWDEPPEYNPRGVLQDKRSGRTQPVATLLFARRIAECADKSWMLAWQSVLYFFVINLLAALGLPDVVAAWKTDLERCMSRLSGALHQTADGRKHPGAVVNLTGPAYVLPPALPKAFAAPDADFGSPAHAHMLAISCRLAYERPAVMRDVIQHWWGMQWHGCMAVPGMGYEQGYAIDCVWFMCSNAHGVILAFRGADPCLQMDRRADIPTGMRHDSVLGGVHAGFLRTLTRASPIQPSLSLWSHLAQELQHVAQHKRIYLTGHSLGGGLAVVFAQLLFARQHPLAQQLAGVITYGAPKAGDSGFVQRLHKSLLGRVLRYEHADDMVVHLPQGYGYAAHGMLRFITSFRPRGYRSRVLEEGRHPAELIDWHCKCEDRAAYVLSAAKLAVSPFKESWGRTLARFWLLPLPGLSDHLIQDYELAIAEANFETAKHDQVG